MRRFAPWRKIGADLLLAVVFGIAATGIAVFALRLTPTSLDERWLTGAGDQVLHYVLFRSAVDVFPFTSNPMLGFPTGQNLFFAPLIDPWSATYISTATLFTHDSVLILNLYQILSFFVTTITSVLFFRLLRLRRPYAVVLGTAFSLLPAHFMQLAIGHPFLANYWSVPLLGVLVLMVGGARTNPLEGWIQAASTTAMRRARRWIPIVVLALLVGLTQSYYFAFAAIIVGGIWAIRLARALIFRDRLARLGWPTVTVATLIAVIGIQLAVLSLNLGDRYTKYFATRTAGASELYGGKITSLLLPWPQTGLPEIGKISAKYFASAPVVPTSEGPWSSVLVIIAMCVVAVILLTRLLSGLAAGERGRRLADVFADPRVTLSVVGFLWSLLFYLTGGLGVIFAFLVSPEVRAWSRISVVMSLFALAAFGVLLQALLPKQRRWTVLALVLISLLVLVDQVGGVYRSVPLQPTADSSLRSLVSTLEKKVAPGCGVAELPVHTFPEGGNVAGMSDYDEGLPYVYSTTLKWSYGAVRGTHSADYWLTATTPAKVEAQITKSKACAILVDTAAYPGAQTWRTIVSHFTDADKPDIVGEDGRLLVFVLH